MAKCVALALLVLLLAGNGCASLTPVARAQQLVRLHREDEAIATLRTELGKHPGDIASRRMLVRILALSSDLEGAKAEVAELARRLPNAPEPWLELGHAYELAHRWDHALEAYDRAAQEAPASALGPREGGMRAARWGEAEDAEPRLVECVRRGGGDAEVFHALGLVRVKLRDFDGATAAYRQGLAADPRSSENLLGLATVAVVKDDAAGALEAYGALLAARPTFASAELGRAWALAKLGRRSEASRALDHAAALGAPRAIVDKQRAALQE